jgi:hypothetical protein
MKGQKRDRRQAGGRKRIRGRPPSPLAPLKVQLDPHVKLDFARAADELHVPLSVLVEHLLHEVRGTEVGTSRIKAAFAKALASHARTAT